MYTVVLTQGLTAPSLCHVRGASRAGSILYVRRAQRRFSAADFVYAAGVYCTDAVVLFCGCAHAGLGFWLILAQEKAQTMCR